MSEELEQDATESIEEAMKHMRQTIRELRRNLSWLLSNFCDTHQTIALMSSGPCGLCELKTEQNFSSSLEDNIKFLNDRVESLTRELKAAAPAAPEPVAEPSEEERSASDHLYSAKLRVRKMLGKSDDDPQWNLAPMLSQLEAKLKRLSEGHK